MCITFAQPHIPVPGLDDLAEDLPNIVNTIHAVQFEKNLVPRLLGLLHQPSKVGSCTRSPYVTDILSLVVPDRLFNYQLPICIM